VAVIGIALFHTTVKRKCLSYFYLKPYRVQGARSIVNGRVYCTFYEDKIKELIWIKLKSARILVLFDDGDTGLINKFFSNYLFAYVDYVNIVEGNRYHKEKQKLYYMLVRRLV
jgi:hypothetical protein